MTIKWIKIDAFNDLQKEMLAAFEDAFDKSNTSYEVVYILGDSIHVRIFGWLNPYNVYNFIKNYPHIYLEIHPRAHRHIEVRMFASEWIREREIPRMMRRANRGRYYLDKQTGVRVLGLSDTDFQKREP